MKLATSYFYQIRNFKPWMIPVSTAISDPEWYMAPAGKEYYIDKRGIVCGLRYEPLIVHKGIDCGCPCSEKASLQGQCTFTQAYKELLNTLNLSTVLKAFEYCASKFQKELGFKEEPIIVLMVHEAWSNPCSERKALQEFFRCQELEYPIC